MLPLKKKPMGKNYGLILRKVRGYKRQFRHYDLEKTHVIVKEKLFERRELREVTPLLRRLQPLIIELEVLEDVILKTMQYGKAHNWTGYKLTILAKRRLDVVIYKTQLEKIKRIFDNKREEDNE